MEKESLTETEEVELESILSRFKFFDWFNIKLIVVLAFVGISNGVYFYNHIFAAAHVDYRCKYDKCDKNENFTREMWEITSKTDRCGKYTLIDGTDNDTCSIDNFNKTNLINCNEWIYKNPQTFVGEYDLACQDWKRTSVGMAHGIGYMVGMLFMGPMSDKFGRKKMLIFSGAAGAFIGVSRSFSGSYWLYVAFETLEGMIGDPYSASYNLGIENVSQKHRVTIISFMTAAVSIGGILNALTAWLIPYWRNYLRAVYIPSFLFFGFILTLDESLRWLLVHGKKTEAVAILRKAIKANNTEIDEDELNRLKTEKKTKNMSLVKLVKMTFSSKTLFLRFLACVTMWISSTLSGFGLLVYSVTLEGDKHVNFALATLSDLIACFCMKFILEKFKRKIPLVIMLILTGLFCFGQPFVDKKSWLAIVLFLAGKFAARIAFATTYLYTAELFPTCTRNTMMALCSSCGRIGSISAPQLPLLIRFWHGVPSLVIGVFSLTAGLITTTLPDTADDSLPDNVDQAEAIGLKRIPNTDNLLEKNGDVS